MGNALSEPVGRRHVVFVAGYDAMTSDRPYRKGFSPEKALAIIEESAGEQFHPDEAKVFLKIKRAQLERGEPVTELENEEVAC